MDDEEWLTADKMAVSIITSNLKLVSEHYRRYYIKKNINIQRSRSYMPIRLYLTKNMYYIHVLGVDT